MTIIIKLPHIRFWDDWIREPEQRKDRYSCVKLALIGVSLFDCLLSTYVGLVFDRKFQEQRQLGSWELVQANTIISIFDTLFSIVMLWTSQRRI